MTREELLKHDEKLCEKINNCDEQELRKLIREKALVESILESTRDIDAKLDLTENSWMDNK